MQKGTQICTLYSLYRQRVLDIERAMAEEIATCPPPKQEIDMACVCVYVLMYVSMYCNMYMV